MTKLLKSLPPGVKTGLICIAAEAFLFLAWLLVTRSVISAIACLLGVLEPISLLIGPAMYWRFSSNQRVKASLSVPAILTPD